MVEPWIIISAILVEEWSTMVFMALISSLDSLAAAPTPSGWTPRERSMSPALACNSRYSRFCRSRAFRRDGSRLYRSTDVMPSWPISAVW